MILYSVIQAAHSRWCSTISSLANARQADQCICTTTSIHKRAIPLFKPTLLTLHTELGYNGALYALAHYKYNQIPEADFSTTLKLLASQSRS